MTNFWLNFKLFFQRPDISKYWLDRNEPNYGNGKEHFNFVFSWVKCQIPLILRATLEKIPAELDLVPLRRPAHILRIVDRCWLLICTYKVWCPYTIDKVHNETPECGIIQLSVNIMSSQVLLHKALFELPYALQGLRSIWLWLSCVCGKFHSKCLRNPGWADKFLQTCHPGWRTGSAACRSPKIHYTIHEWPRLNFLWPILNFEEVKLLQIEGRFPGTLHEQLEWNSRFICFWTTKSLKLKDLDFKCFGST